MEDATTMTETMETNPEVEEQLTDLEEKINAIHECSIFEDFSVDSEEVSAKLKSEREKLEAQIAKVNELAGLVHTSCERNRKLSNSIEAMLRAGLSDDAIRAAMEKEFGKPKGKRTPVKREGGATETEKRVLSAMTSEGMNKRQVFEAAGLNNKDPQFDGLLQGLASAGWISNTGSKGAGAQWVLTDAGKEQIEV